jgi:hypothetical protein
MIIRSFLLALYVLLCSGLPVFAKGSGSANKDDPLNAEHINVLPREIRNYIAGICKGPARAQHDFATYNPQEHRWRINLEYLHCSGLAEFRRSNQCLDVDFVAVGSGYRLAKRNFADCGF